MLEALLPQLYPAAGPVLVAAAIRAWGSAAQDKTARSWAWFGLGVALAALGFDGTRQLRAQLAGPLAAMLPIVGGGVLALWAHTGYLTWKQLDPRPARLRQQRADRLDRQRREAVQQARELAAAERGEG